MKNLLSPGPQLRTRLMLENILWWFRAIATSLQMSGGRSGVNVCTGYMSCFVKCSEYLAVCTAKKFLVVQHWVEVGGGGGGGGGCPMHMCTCVVW